MLQLLRRMQTGQLSQAKFSLKRLTQQTQPACSFRALPQRSGTSGASRTSRTNLDQAFTSVSSALGLEGIEDTRKIQQLRPVAAQAAPSYSTQEEETVGEVDFAADMRNNIQIMGNIGREIDYRVLATNRLVHFSLAIQNKNKEAEWVDVEAWGSLAESANQLLGKGVQVAVQGRLKQDKWTDPSGQSRSRLKVVANSINKVRSNYGASQGQAPYARPAYVEPASTSPGMDQTYQDRSYQQMDQEYAPPPPPPQQYQAPQTSYPQPSYSSNPAEEKWKVFFQDRGRYWDNRVNKRNPKAPDFKHKDSGDGLWLNGAPQWVQDELDTPDLGGPVF